MVHALSGLRKGLFTAIAFAGIALEVSCESDHWFCDHSVVFGVQGGIVFLLGLSVVFDSLIECVLFSSLSTLEPGGVRVFTILGLPTVWLLLAWSTLSERTYFCDAMPCAAKHYIYPSIMVLASSAVCGAVRSFWSVLS